MLTSKKFWFILFLTCAGLFAVAQKPTASETELRKQADKHFSNSNFVEANPLYSQLLSLFPHDALLNYRYGVSLMEAGKEKTPAIVYLDFATKHQPVPEEAWLYLGKAHMAGNNYSRAGEAFTKYKSIASPSKSSKAEIDLLIANSMNAELVSKSRKDIAILNSREIKRLNFHSAYDFSESSGKLVATASQFLTTQDKDKQLNPVMFITKDGQSIYYSSYGRGGNTGKDIYLVRKMVNGQWGTPENLGMTLNSSENEDFPYLDRDGRTLYFSSRGHNSIGGYDLFKSVFDYNTNQWSKPENLGIPVNTTDDDLFYVPTLNGDKAIYCTAYESGYGNVILREISLGGAANRFAIIAGTYFSLDQATRRDARITVIRSSDNAVVNSVRTDPKSGKYELVLPPGNDYTLIVEGGSYLPHAEQFSLPNLAVAGMRQEVKLDKDKEREQMTVSNFFTPLSTKTDEPVLAFNNTPTNVSTSTLNSSSQDSSKMIPVKLDDKIVYINDPKQKDQGSQDIIPAKAQSVANYGYAEGIYEPGTLNDIDSEETNKADQKGLPSITLKEKDRYDPTLETKLSDDELRQIEEEKERAQIIEEEEKNPAMLIDFNIDNDELARIALQDAQALQEESERMKENAESLKTNASLQDSLASTLEEEYANLGKEDAERKEDLKQRASELREESFSLNKQASDLQLQASIKMDESRAAKHDADAIMRSSGKTVTALATKTETSQPKKSNNTKSNISEIDPATNNNYSQENSPSESTQADANENVALNNKKVGTEKNPDKQTEGLESSINTSTDIQQNNDVSGSSLAVVNKIDNVSINSEGTTDTKSGKVNNEIATEQNDEPALMAKSESNEEATSSPITAKEKSIADNIKTDLNTGTIEKSSSIASSDLANSSTDVNNIESSNLETIRSENNEVDKATGENSAGNNSKEQQTDNVASSNTNNSKAESTLAQNSSQNPIEVQADNPAEAKQTVQTTGNTATSIENSAGSKIEEHTTEKAHTTNNSDELIASQASSKANLSNQTSEGSVSANEQTKNNPNLKSENKSDPAPTLVEQTTSKTTKSIGTTEAAQGSEGTPSEIESIKTQSGEDGVSTSTESRATNDGASPTSGNDQPATFANNQSSGENTTSELNATNSPTIQISEVENKLQPSSATVSKIGQENSANTQTTEPVLSPDHSIAIREAGNRNLQVREKYIIPEQLQVNLDPEAKVVYEAYESSVKISDALFSMSRTLQDRILEMPRSPERDSLVEVSNAMSRQSTDQFEVAQTQLADAKLLDPKVNDLLVLSDVPLAKNIDRTSTGTVDSEQLAINKSADFIANDESVETQKSEQVRDIDLTSKIAPNGSSSDVPQTTATKKPKSDVADPNEPLRRAGEELAINNYEEDNVSDANEDESVSVVNSTAVSTNSNSTKLSEGQEENVPSIKPNQSPNAATINLPTVQTTTKADDVDAGIDVTHPRYEAYQEVQEKITEKQVETINLFAEGVNLNKLSVEEKQLQINLLDSANNVSDETERVALLQEAEKLKIQSEEHQELSKVKLSASQAKTHDVKALTSEMETIKKEISQRPTALNSSTTNSPGSDPDLYSTGANKQSLAEKTAMAKTSGAADANTTTRNLNSSASSTAINTIAAQELERLSIEMYSVGRGPAYNEVNPIPLNPGLPDGLVFKVQVGAFHKPIPDNTFKNLQPVSAETTRPGWLRYCVGLFKTFEPANLVKKELRRTGYKDAFVVAYLNGKRISLQEANAMINRQENQLAYTGEMNKEIGALRQLNVIPATAKSGPKDNDEQLFYGNTTPPSVNAAQENLILEYSVQIGVYRTENPPVILNSLEPIYTEAIPRGLYRFTSGRYENRSDAETAKLNAISKGVSDAFVVAVKGRRNVSMPSTATQREPASTNNVASSEKILSNNAPNENSKSSVSVPGIRFKVQLGAFRQNVPFETVEAFLKVSDKGIVRVTDERALNIFYAGDFADFESARLLKEDVVSKGVTDAFVVALQDGKRIPLTNDLQGKD